MSANLPRRSVASLVAMAVLVASCSGIGPSPVQHAGGGVHVVGADAMSLGVSNRTTLTVTVVVNGYAIRTLEPGTVVDAIPASALPAIPWAVEARSSTGRVLISMSVNAGDVWQAAAPNGTGVVGKGPWGNVALSCGRIDLWAWAGSLPPLPSGPAFGSSGDCAP